MIKNLYISNYILMDEVSLDFNNGFSAFIGETGAGKSILIDAISVFIKERNSSSNIGKYKDKAIIEAVFDLRNDEYAINYLNDSGFEIDPSEVIFTKEIAKDKSVSRINHRVVKASLISDILKYQLDIHNQRDNQYLLNDKIHINLLDEYCGLGEERKQVESLFKAYSDLVKERDTALNQTYNESDLEFFEHQINEIDAADLKIGEDDELEEKEKTYKAFKNSLDTMNQAINTYDGLSEQFYQLNRLVENLDDVESLNNIKTNIKDSYYQLDDAIQELKKQLDSLDVSEDDINNLEERLFLIQNMKRKYGRTIQEILNKRESLQQQVDLFENRQAFLDEINKKIDNAYKAFEDKAKALSAKRKKGAKKLDDEIIVHLHDLALMNAQFHTNITSCEANRNGLDKVEFLVNMNKGEDLKPLGKVASGGELSRLMLGLKTIFTSLENISTVIFDEIDTGVSGVVASAIGKKMQELSNSTQVFSVTHLAQVVACAKYVYYVEKFDNSSSSTIKVTQLSEEDIIKQISIISSGKETPASIKAAKELRQRNK